MSIPKLPWRSTVEDTPARLGGDEFGILLEEDVRGAVRVAERIGRGFHDPWSISSGEVALGVSIGVASREGDEELDQLLLQADEAMYAAKAGGQDWRVFALGGCRSRGALR